MKRKQKKNIYIPILMLLAVGLGLGYAILTEKLSITNTVHYGAISWDVGFSETSDGGGTVTAAPAISQDKKTITVTCNLGTSTKSETCIAKAKISNNSTFAVELSSDPTITYENDYISSVSAQWTSNLENVAKQDIIAANATEELKITIVTKELTEDMLPSEQLSIPVTFTMDLAEKSN